MPFESFDEAARFGGGKGFVERRSRMRAEIVLHQNDLVRAGKMHVGQILERVGVIDGRAPVRSSGANIMNRLATPLRSYS